MRFAHALTTIPTAGLLDEGRLDGGFAPATQWVIVLFMILGGINFALMYRAIVRRQPRALAATASCGCTSRCSSSARRAVGEIWTEDVLVGRARSAPASSPRSRR